MGTKLLHPLAHDHALVVLKHLHERPGNIPLRILLGEDICLALKITKDIEQGPITPHIISTVTADAPKYMHSTLIGSTIAYAYIYPFCRIIAQLASQIWFRWCSNYAVCLWPAFGRIWASVPAFIYDWLSDHHVDHLLTNA